MKKQKTLRLHRETLRDLHQQTLSNAQGGLSACCHSECTFCIDCVTGPPPV